MSAREELFRRVAGAFVSEDRANKLIDDVIAEAVPELEKLRARVAELEAERSQLVSDAAEAIDQECQEYGVFGVGARLLRWSELTHPSQGAPALPPVPQQRGES